MSDNTLQFLAAGSERRLVAMVSVEHQLMLVVAFWGILIVVSAFMLRQACSIFGEGMPYWGRALFMVVFVGGAVYLTMDFLAYVILLSINGVMLDLPPGYSYHNWLSVPLTIKWQVVSAVPLVRYMILAVAFCVGGVLQTLLLDLQVPFRKASLIFAAQWLATVIAGALLLFVMSHVVSSIAAPVEPGTAGPTAGRPPISDPRVASSSIQLKKTAAEAEVTAQVAWNRFVQMLDPYLAEVKEAFAPLTQYLPAPVHEFLDAGGWWLLFGAAGVIMLLWLRGLLRSLRRTFSRSRKKKRRKKSVPLRLHEDLTPLEQIFTDEQSQRLLVKGVRARLRLAVLAAARSGGESLHEETLEYVLDWIKPGLAAACSTDYPRVRVWPPFPSKGGFDQAFAQNVPVPAAKGLRSRWALVSGRVHLGQQKINLGLALYTDEPTTLRHIKVGDEQWLDVFQIERARAGAGV